MNDTVKAIAERYAGLNEAIRKGHLLQKDSSLLLADRYAYPVTGDSVGIASLDAVSKDAGAINEQEKSILFVVSTEEVDRDGDRVRSLGVQTEGFAKNDVWFWGHRSEGIPLGKGRGPDGALCVWPQEHRVLAKCWFDPQDEDAMAIFSKYARKYLHATSIAFVPIRAFRMEVEEKATTHHTPLQPPGWAFEDVALTEISCCGIPANENAVVFRQWLDEDRKHISPRLQKSLSAYCATAKGCWNGWCPCPPCEQKAVEKVGDAGWQSAANQLSGLGKGRVIVVNGHKVKRDKLGYFSVDGSEGLTHHGALEKIFPEGYEEGKAAPTPVRKYIAHSGDKWIVHAESGRVLGTHNTEADAKRQLAAVEANKHKALQPPTRIRPEIDSTNVLQLVHPGDTLVARTFITTPTDTNLPFARTGEPLRVNEVGQFQLVVENRRGQTTRVTTNKVRLKAAPATKSCGCSDCQAHRPCGCKGKVAKASAEQECVSRKIEYLVTEEGRKPPSEDPQTAAIAYSYCREGKKGARPVSVLPKQAKAGDLRNAARLTQLRTEGMGKLQNYLNGGAQTVGLFEQGWDRLRAAGYDVDLRREPSEANARQLLSMAQQRPAPGGKGMKGKQLLESSGTAGGYTVPVNPSTDATGTEGRQGCLSCDGSGNCPACRGLGEAAGMPCAECGGSGDCPECGGVGFVEKPVDQVGGVPPVGKGVGKAGTGTKVEIKPYQSEYGRSYGVFDLSGNMLSGPHSSVAEAEKVAARARWVVTSKGATMSTRKTPRKPAAKAPARQRKKAEGEEERTDITPGETPFETEGKSEESEFDTEATPFEPKQSAQVLAGLYAHAKEEHAYVDGQLPRMDNEGVSGALKDLYAPDKPRPSMEDIKGVLAEHHPDHDMDAMLKDLEGGGPADTETGEANLVDRGEIPPDAEAQPDDDDDEEDDEDEEEMASDPDTDEILERYQTGKGWVTRTVGRVRVAKDGRKFLVRKTTTCPTCGQSTSDPRHDHPHDYNGTLEAFNSGKPCLACNRVHATQNQSKSLRKQLTDQGNPAELTPAGPLPAQVALALGAAADHMDSLAGAPDLPAHHAAGLQHHAQVLRGCMKDLTSEGPAMANDPTSSTMQDGSLTNEGNPVEMKGVQKQAFRIGEDVTLHLSGGNEDGKVVAYGKDKYGQTNYVVQTAKDRVEADQDDLSHGHGKSAKSPGKPVSPAVEKAYGDLLRTLELRGVKLNAG